MCKCIVQINKKLSDAGINTKLDIPLLLDGGVSRVSVKVCKINSESRKKPISVFSSFCPFCGVKYES